MGSSFYYLSLAVFCLSVGIYNLSVYSSSAGLQCYNESLMDAETFKQYNSTFASGVAPSLYYPNPNDTTTIYVRQAASNTYNIFLIILSILYLSIMVFSLNLAIIVSSMANMLPEDFMNIGRCKKWSAILCKVLPPLFTILSWIIMILVIAIWVFIVMQSCIYSTTANTGLFDPGEFFKSVNTLNLVNSALWFFMHYIMSIFKEIVYQEPFMYAPDDANVNFAVICLFKKLGP